MVTKKRVLSLDVFRGITVAAMIFVNTLPISPYTPYLLKHSEWIGLTFVDLVFPFFLFIVGVSMAYSFKNRAKQSSKQLWGHFIYRVAALFCIGLFLNWIGGGMPLRIPGVLQLIALTSLFAAPLARSKVKYIVLTVAVLLMLQSSILLFSSAPGVMAGNFQSDGNIAGGVDVQVFGVQHIYNQNVDPGLDPEGILAIITATAMVLIGLIFGKTLQIRGGNWGTVKLFLTAGAVLIFLGFLISPWVPIIKQLWTASFIMVTAGMATILLSVLYSYLDILDKKSILRIAVPLGLNALILYVLSAVINTLIQKIYLYSATGDPISIYQMLYQPLMDLLTPNIGVLTYATIGVVFWGIMAYYMHKKKIYIKL